MGCSDSTKVKWVRGKHINKKNMNNLTETSQDIIRQIIGEKTRRKSISM